MYIIQYSGPQTDMEKLCKTWIKWNVLLLQGYPRAVIIIIYRKSKQFTNMELSEWDVDRFRASR